MQYQEIENLKSDFNNHAIHISEPFDYVRKDLFYITLSIDNSSWKLLIDDEYGDFSRTNKLINWYLILAALESYRETEDILEWSKELCIEPSRFLDYYKNLDKIYKEIEHLLGKIDAQISSYDYSLRTGVMKALLKEKLD
ncbi:hypothetical protein [Tenacibaculum sp. 190524A05c]|uniref:Uncharacterized protein n=1 Tax=Tenacibaculum platacis TaxID=3137852 RepID=A0ABM9P2F4_9FLAO